MTVETTYTAARTNLAKLCDRVVDDRDTIIIHRRSGRDVALIAADEWASVMETAHLLSSPRNRARLAKAIQGVRRGRGRVMSMQQLRREVERGPKS